MSCSGIENGQNYLRQGVLGEGLIQQRGTLGHLDDMDMNTNKTFQKFE